MNEKNFCYRPGSRSLSRILASGAMLAVALLAGAPAQAAFHLWNIREIYSDASGTNQFIEFYTPYGSQQYVNNVSITVSSGGTTHTLTMTNDLPGDSAGRAFIIATASVTNYGAPKPDFIIPNNFVFPGGGDISFYQASGTYTALPTNGVLSRTWPSGDAVNSPQNFVGQTGQIVIPPGNTPPLVSITNPSNNSIFLPGATVNVGVSATDSDGSVANVRLFTNGVVAATNSVAPFGFTLNSIARGDYTLSAIAIDNQSLASTSAVVFIRVSDGPVLSFSRGTNGPIQFRFNSINGASYVIERGTPLTNFIPILTNPGNGGLILFSETNNGDSQRTYRVRKQ
jgi:hypothetical protein